MIQIDSEIREMTEQEEQNFLAMQSEAQQQEAEEQASISVKQSALAKLAALGLTEEEIAAL
jgi:DNA-binding NarL/FixJ family response regulator